MNEDFKVQRRKMVEGLVREGIIKSEKIAQAFMTVPREEFVWPDSECGAYADSPMPLGHTGQTISAPHMVAIMLEELDLQPGLDVLEVGAGSGYNAALMAEILRSESGKDKGHVTTVERIVELVEFARKNLELTCYHDTVTVVEGDGTLGYPERSERETYDRIVVTAAAPHLPRYLKRQLKVDGILLVPAGDLWSQDLVKAKKLEGGRFSETKICSCMFVPLVGIDGYR